MNLSRRAAELNSSWQQRKSEKNSKWCFHSIQFNTNLTKMNMIAHCSNIRIVKKKSNVKKNNLLVLPQEIYSTIAFFYFSSDSQKRNSFI